MEGWVGWERYELLLIFDLKELESSWDRRKGK
jgi:hypothetical protein